MGTILGSAAFNILFVIALCALISATIYQLDPYPIVRDGGYYCIAVVVLFVIIYDQRVYWYEALVLLLLYFIYVAILKFNDRLLHFIRRNPSDQINKKSNNSHHFEQSKMFNDSVELEQNLTARARSVSESVAINTSTIYNQYRKRRSTYRPCSKRLQDTLNNHQIVANATEIFNPLKLPTKRYKILKWMLMYPVRLLMHITIPDCRKDVFHNYYMLTFVMSTIWVNYKSLGKKRNVHFLLYRLLVWRT